MLGIGLTGCNTTSCYVINQDEIVLLKKGDALIAPYDGTYYSHNAEQRIMNAKIIATKLK